MRIKDISVPLTTAPVWPGEGGLDVAAKVKQGVTVSTLRLGSHSGTHVDAPSHFFPGGRSVHDLPLEHFIGEALVLHIPSCRSVGLRELEGRIPVGTRRLLLRTDNSSLLRTGRFSEEYTSLDAPAADYLAALGIFLVGTDYLSIEAFHAPANPVHRILLGNGVVILEGLDLSDVEAGTYTLVALPLPLPGVDGSPVRAVLLQGLQGDSSGP